MSRDSASLERKEKNWGRKVRKAITRNSPQVGFEPTTSQLTADRSTTELLRKNSLQEADSRSLDQPMTEQKRVRNFFSHTPGKKRYDSKQQAPPRLESLHPGQRGGGQPSTLEIRIDQLIFASCQFTK